MLLVFAGGGYYPGESWGLGLSLHISPDLQTHILSTVMYFLN